MKDNNFESLQSAIVDHMSNYIDDKDKREKVKSGLNELMFVFKCKFFELQEDILKAVNEKLVGSNLSPINLPEKPKRDTYQEKEEKEEKEEIIIVEKDPTTDDVKTD